MNTRITLKMQWTPTFCFNIIGKVQYFLIIAICQLIPMTLHIPFNRKNKLVLGWLIWASMGRLKFQVNEIMYQSKI